MGDAVNVKSADNHNVAHTFLNGYRYTYSVDCGERLGEGKGREGEGGKGERKEHLLLQFW